MMPKGHALMVGRGGGRVRDHKMTKRNSIIASLPSRDRTVVHIHPSILSSSHGFEVIMIAHFFVPFFLFDSSPLLLLRRPQQRLFYVHNHEQQHSPPYQSRPDKLSTTPFPSAFFSHFSSIPSHSVPMFTLLLPLPSRPTIDRQKKKGRRGGGVICLLYTSPSPRD